MMIKLLNLYYSEVPKREWVPITAHLPQCCHVIKSI